MVLLIDTVIFLERRIGRIGLWFITLAGRLMEVEERLEVRRQEQFYRREGTK